MDELSKKIFKTACQSEKLFLWHNNEVLQAIKTLQGSTQALIIYSRLYNSEVIHAYEGYVDFISKLVLEIGIKNNSISYSEIISELINRGYISHNNRFIYDKSSLNDIFGCQGINIINGSGCCRHTSNIHKDIFNHLDMYSEFIQCNIYNTEVSINEMYHNPSNHAVNLIRYNGVYYLYDSLNKTIFVPIKLFTMAPHSIYQERDTRLYYKPSADMIINNKTYGEVMGMILKLWYNSRKEQIGIGELYDIVTQTRSTFDKESSVLNDFKEESKTYIKRIVSLLKKEK